MGLVYNNQVIVIDCGHGISIIVEDTLYHSLYGSNLDAGLRSNLFIFQPLDIIDVGQGHQIPSLTSLNTSNACSPRAVRSTRKRMRLNRPVFKKR